MSWKYLAMSSGFPFSLLAYLILPNVWILVCLGLHFFLLSPLFRQIPSIGPYVSEGTQFLLPDLPALSLPLDLILNNVTAYDPIVSLPLAVHDITADGHQLLKWMGGSETPNVLVSCSSHLALSEEDSSALAKGLARVHPRLLVSRKRKVPEDDYLTSVTAALENLWTVVGGYLLTRPGVVAHVHHGGTNTYFETCR